MTSFAFIVLCFVQVYVLQPTSGSCQVPCTPSNTPAHIFDYYWRDYVGIIPEDAIPGGKDKAGVTTYIGQVYIKDRELLPATIYPGCKTARASAYNKELQTEKNVKILCGRHLEKYKWKTTKNEETHLLTDCHLVVGGHEVGHNLNFGRVNHDGQVVVGKVFSNPLSNRGLWIPYNGQETHFLSYEILTYGC
ncbi:hypothetical protein ILUMI_06050 [Ignelater luminosus]|uniref:Uncharacterized protein n=1 Tax=Ignelater luminosus TaxID=2038154 RepID=A0A8K0GFS4_IGNLU|nr:hypothetical protein ILUMI_06050 [Ignelater luminosus]